MGIFRTGMYLTPLCSWEAAEQCAVYGIGTGRLVGQESGVESKSARGVNSMNIHRIGTCLTPLCSLEGAEHCPGNRNGIGHLGVEESRFEYWDRQELAWLLRHSLF